MRILTATIDMSENIIAYVKKVAGETQNLMMNPEEFSLTVEQEENYIKSQLDSRLGNILVAFDGDQVVGLCGMQGREGRKRIGHMASLGISVSKSHWGQGIGYKLMLGQIEYAKKNLITKINLEVRTDNPSAVKLYEKCGFLHEGINKRSMLLDGKYVDNYYMGLIL